MVSSETLNPVVLSWRDMFFPGDDPILEGKENLVGILFLSHDYCISVTTWSSHAHSHALLLSFGLAPGWSVWFGLVSSTRMFWVLVTGKNVSSFCYFLAACSTEACLMLICARHGHGHVE